MSRLEFTDVTVRFGSGRGAIVAGSPVADSTLADTPTPTPAPTPEGGPA
ncbi:MAG: hypothetical protein LBJ08_06405 [Bifidobacteriaceae bacterium]|jgi:hypothetical protein|nr:hypothetical protein [Bifidobacteriaceae bacterium]